MDLLGFWAGLEKCDQFIESCIKGKKVKKKWNNKNTTTMLTRTSNSEDIMIPDIKVLLFSLHLNSFGQHFVHTASIINLNKGQRIIGFKS